MTSDFFRAFVQSLVRPSSPRRIALRNGLLACFFILFFWGGTSFIYRARLIAEQRTHLAGALFPYSEALTLAMDRRLALLQNLRAFALVEHVAGEEHEGSTERMADEFPLFAGKMVSEAPGIRRLTLILADGTWFTFPPSNAPPLAPPSLPLAAQQTVATGKIVLEGPLEHPPAGNAMSAWLAIRLDGDGSLLAVANITFDLQAVLQETGLLSPPPDVQLALRDAGGRILYGPAETFRRRPVIQKVEIPSGAWALAGAPTPDGERTLRAKVTLYRFIGVLMALLSGELVYLATNRQARLQMAVQERTRQIARINAELRRELDRRRRIEAERERLLAAEREQRLLAETLAEVTLALTAHTDRDAVLDEILQQAGRIVPYRAANISMLEGDKLHIVRWRGYEEFGQPDIGDFLLSLTDLPLEEEAVAGRKPLLVPDTRREPRWIVFEESKWIRSHLAIPICHHDRVLGFLRLDSDRPGEFSLHDAERLQPLTAAAAIALENARLYEQARKDAETQAILLREVNHRVKNNLASIIGLLYMERSHMPEEARALYQPFINDLINRVQGLATAHNLLSASKWQPILLSDLARRVIHAALQMHPAAEPVPVEVEPSPVRVSPAQANNLALVLNELATNTLKYAASEPDRVRITVRISQNGNTIRLEFRDNGPGYPPDVLQGERQNVGLYLIRTLTGHGLQGEVTLRNEGGAVVLLTFPADG